MFEPRAWQLEARDAFRRYDTDGKWAMVVAATGTGKTALGHLLAMDYLERGERVLWIADQNELVTQPLATLRKWWPNIRGGIVQAAEDNPSAQIVYASKRTIENTARRNAILDHGEPALVVADEAHRSASKGWRDLLRSLSAGSARVLGLTATPDRDDNKSLSELWNIVYSYSVLDGIADGVLVQPYVTEDRVPELDLSGVSDTAGDYDANQMERELMRAHIVEHTVASIQQTHLAESLPFRDGTAYFSPEAKGILVFTISVAQAEATASALRDAGFVAHTVHGKTPKKLRARLLAAFTRGEIDVLCSPAALTTGVDLPYAKVGVLARATKSWPLYVQILGRLLRPYEGEDKALLLDLVGASRHHSIIAAPVLVDGSDCEDSPDGRHRYLEIEGTHEGRCQHCGQICKCARNQGGHLFKDGRCKHCRAEQCPESPDLQHHWVPWTDNKRCCVHCAMEIPDPFSLLGKRHAPPKEPVAWKRIACPGRVYAAQLGSVGVLFNVETTGGWRPYLHASDRLTALSPSPVTAEMTRLLTDDVARRAAKRKGVYGLQGSGRAMRRACMDAERLAKSLTIWDTP